jgi:putative hydrolase of the HAD superfamily
VPVTPPITTLFLDIGGVLLTNGWDRASRRRAASQFNLDFEVLDERHHLTFDTYEEGKLSLDTYLDRVVFYQDRQFTRESFKEFMYAQSQPFPGMIDYFQELKDRHGFKTGAISNEGKELTEYRINQFGLDKLIDFFACSCFVHYRKPDTDIFRIALDIAQTLPGEAIYIDDRPLFVEVARTLGLNGIVHTDLDSTRLALENMGVRLAG